MESLMSRAINAPPNELRKFHYSMKGGAIKNEAIKGEVLFMENPAIVEISEKVYDAIKSENNCNPYDFILPCSGEEIMMDEKKDIISCMNRQTFASVGMIQELHDLVLPCNAAHDLTFDSYMVATEPMHIEIDNAVVTMDKRAPIIKTINYDKLKPNLRTEMYTKRPITQYETLLALVKRNHNIPELAGIVDMETLAEKMHERFMNTYFTDQYNRVMFRQEEICVNPVSIQSWLEGQLIKLH